MRVHAQYAAICLAFIVSTGFSAEVDQIRELVTRAQDRTSPVNRAEAVRKLFPYCANNSESLSAVVKALAVEDWRLRLEIADVVLKSGTAAIPFLAQSNSENAREAEVMCAWIIRRIARENLKAAFLATKDRTSQREVVAAAIADDISGFLPVLQQLVASEEFVVSAGAAKAIEIAGSDARVAIPTLIEGLRKQRHWCASALVAMGDEAVRPLVAALNDDFVPVREYSAQTLGKMRLKPGEVVPALINALSDDSMDVRVKAAQALGHYASDARDALPKLMEFASSTDTSYKNSNLRKYSAEALGRIAPTEPKVVDALILCLESADDDSRINSIRALTEAGPAATKGVPKLLQLSKSGRTHERGAVLNGLGRIAPKQADVIAVLCAALKDKEETVRDEAKRALVHSGATALPVLKELAADTTSFGSHYARQAIEAINAENARKSTPKAQAAKSAVDPATKVKSTQNDELSKLDLLADDTAQKLVGFLADRSVEKRLLAMEKLTAIGDRAKPTLLGAMSDRNSSVGNGAAYCLSRGGPQALDDAISLISSVPPPQDIQRLQQNITLLAGYIGPAAYPLVIQNLSNQRLRSTMVASLPLLGPPPPEAQALLIKLVKGTSFSEKIIALRCLSAASHNADIVAILTTSLDDKNSQIRRVAVEGLGNLGPAAKSAVPSLKKLLGDRELKSLVEVALKRISKDESLPATDSLLDSANAKAKVPELIKNVQSNDLRTRILALNELQRCGAEGLPAVPALIAALNANSGSIVGPAGYALRKIAPFGNDETVKLLEDAIRLKPEQPNFRPRKELALALGTMGIKASSAAKTLFETSLSGDKNPDLAQECSRALGRIAAADPASMQVLTEHLNSTDSKILQRIGDALFYAGSAGFKFVITSLKSNDSAQRRNAARMLQEAVRALGASSTADFFDEAARKEQNPVHSEYYRETAELYRKIHREYIEVIQASAGEIIQLLKDEDAEVRTRAGNYLQAMRGMSLNTLIQGLNDDNWQVRMQSISVLRTLDAEAKDAVAAVIRALKDPNGAVRDSARACISSLAPHAIPEIVAALNDPDPAIQSVLLGALTNSGPRSKEALTAIIEKIGSNEATVRTQALHTLSQVGKGSDVAVTALVSKIQDKDKEIRAEVAGALGKMEAYAKNAVPALITALDDEDWNVRVNAATALIRISPSARRTVPELNVRVNEIVAVDNLLAYAKAQANYLLQDWNKNGRSEYAKSFRSDDSAGLCDVKMIRAEMSEGERAEGLHGYRFKFLLGQGDKAQGGTKSYLIDGVLSGGHALLAYPVEYGKTGRATFMINTAATVYQKDLGKHTAIQANQTTVFNPDQTWSPLQITTINELKKATPQDFLEF